MFWSLHEAHTNPNEAFRKPQNSLQRPIAFPASAKEARSAILVILALGLGLLGLGLGVAVGWVGRLVQSCLV